MTTGNGNGLLGKAERWAKVFERVSDPRVLIAAMIAASGVFYWYGLRRHDTKLDVLLDWTNQKNAYDFLACLQRAESEAEERLCDAVRAGQPIDLSRVREERRP